MLCICLLVVWFVGVCLSVLELIVVTVVTVVNVCLPVCLFDSLSVCMFDSLYFCFFVCLYVCFFVFLFHCLFVCLFLCLFDSLSVCFFVCCFFRLLFLCLFVCLPVCLFVCLQQVWEAPSLQSRQVGPNCFHHVPQPCPLAQLTGKILNYQHQSRNMNAGINKQRSLSITRRNIDRRKPRDPFDI